ncbi:ribosomal protection-like ABC-F family protein [Arcobacter sp. FWKO B]|uniref:ribosomal protection-like ABC-F family protein n=1 Tax=Arcobacter sp. FWKO B TaxID=2593672 RepID=UPI0018A4E0BE|nr:ABC-F family ATP-binding cassette domain-containing protein [Arcobacter sp. FWKO B]QOG12868.1 ABC-F family ATP-binding cassette domain-containing protein [Arcobacter sp. FWKO B]
MALIDLQNINKQYDIKVILKDVNFTLLQGQRIAVIGQNGHGKSTLFKIIMGQVLPDSGDIAIDKSIKIEMLDQSPKFEPNITVKEAIASQLKELQNAKIEYDEISNRLINEYENSELIRRHSELGSYLDYHNAWDLDNKVDQVIDKLQLKEYEDKKVNLLSGGEQRRVSLAGLLLKKPDVLLLDEPTNHLDVYMVEFLEQMLLKENFTLLFVSHDRYFIDNIATSTVEIDRGVLRRFQGGYSSYLEQKAQILSNMQKEHEDMLDLYKKEQYWMQHGISARRKRNERRKSEYLALKEKIKTNPAQINKMRLELQREQRVFNGEKAQNKRKQLFELDKITKSLGDKLLIKDFSTRILQRDKIAIVGPNGSGKSTLLRILLETLEVDSGIIKKGDFKIGYFDQHRTMLDDDKNIMETFCPVGGDRVKLSDGRDLHVYGYLKNFLFPKEYLDKKIGALSGGEKNRVALALLFTKDIDCLILDEPTNDLDLPTINILEEYLANFQGALIFVSHDRYFVDKIASKLFIFRGNGEIIESMQPYSEYLEIEKELEDLADYEKELESAPKMTQQTEPKKQTKLSYKEQREYDSLPSLIEELELKIKELNTCLSNPKCYEQRGIIAVSSELEEIKAEYEAKVERYLELEMKVEELKG